MTKILFFGRLKDPAGMAEQLADLTGLKTSQDLIQHVAEDNIELAQALSDPTVRILVNQSLQIDKYLPPDIEEVAFLPPLSGG